MDEEKKSLDIKQAAAMEKLADALEKLPTSMARNTSREKAHEQNAGQLSGSQFATDAMRSLHSDTGQFGLLKSVPHPAAQMAGAAVDAMAQGNAYQYQQEKPYEDAKAYAVAAGQAGITLTPAQTMQVRDFYRDQIGKPTKSNLDLVDQQNSPYGSRIQRVYQATSQWFTDSVQSDALGTIMFGSDAYYHQTSPEVQRRLDQIYAQDRVWQRQEYEAK